MSLCISYVYFSLAGCQVDDRAIQAFEVMVKKKSLSLNDRYRVEVITSQVREIKKDRTKKEIIFAGSARQEESIEAIADVFSIELLETEMHKTVKLLREVLRRLGNRDLSKTQSLGVSRMIFQRVRRVNEIWQESKLDLEKNPIMLLKYSFFQYLILRKKTCRLNELTQSHHFTKLL